jgi:hypothetical protein
MALQTLIKQCKSYASLTVPLMLRKQHSHLHFRPHALGVGGDSALNATGACADVLSSGFVSVKLRSKVIEANKSRKTPIGTLHSLQGHWIFSSWW